MKKYISLLLAFVMMFTIAIPCSSIDSHAALSGCEEVFDNDVIQKHFDRSDTEDRYQITATDTKYYKFTFLNQSVELRTGISIADNLINHFFGKINIQITDQYDLILSEFSVRCGYQGNVSLKFTKDSTYYIKVTSNLEGYYRMKVNSYADIGGDTWNNATETLSVGQLISSIDASGDIDWFYFDTDDTDSFYDFSLENISGSSTMYLELYEYVEGAGEIPLRDNKIGISAGSSRTANKQLKLDPNTRYYMKVYLSKGIGGYQLDITQTLDAVGDKKDTAYEVQPDTKVTTALDGKGDVDFFKFTTKDYDAYYYFNIENLSIDSTCYIYIYDADDNQLKKNDAYRSDFSTNIKLPPNTEYFFAICSTSSGVGNYKVTVTTEKDFYPNTLKEAKKINIDETVSESISGHGDNDFYKFTTADYDAYYYVNVENLSIDSTCYIYIYDADGNQLKMNDAYRSDFSTNIKLSPNTEYFFKINSSSSGVGNYKVTLTAKADPQGDTKDKAYEIGLNEQLTCELTSDNDVDWFKFSVNRDKNLRFVFTNESGNYKYFYIYSAIDKKLLESYCTESAEKTILLEAGDYYIKVYGKDGYYTLAVAECASGHVETSNYLEATLEDDGVKTTFCKYCQKVMGKEFVPRIDSVSLSYTTAVYNKKPQKPEVLVYDIDGTVIPSSQYDVKYPSEMIEVGTYSIEVIFKDKYAGTKTLEFEIKSVGSDGFYMCGDVDGNGVVNIKDATAIQKFIAGMTIPVFYESVADADENGSINVKDATAIQKWIASLLPDSNIGKYPNK